MTRNKKHGRRKGKVRKRPPVHRRPAGRCSSLNTQPVPALDDVYDVVEKADDEKQETSEPVAPSACIIA